MNKIYPKENEGKNEVLFPTITEVYKSSRIDHYQLNESFIIMAAKTSNNQQIMNDMPFHEFNTAMKFLNIYLDKETDNSKAQEPGNENAQSQQDAAKDKANKEFAKAKSNMKKPGKK